jgi:phytoene/squalene synthetase
MGAAKQKGNYEERRRKVMEREQESLRRCSENASRGITVMPTRSNINIAMILALMGSTGMSRIR